MELKRVKIVSVTSQTLSLIRKAILSGEFQSGQQITLESVANLVGASRTPVREAFQVLALEGLIELRPNRAAIVRGISPKILKDYYETRIILECAVMNILCKKDVNFSPLIAVCDSLDSAYHNKAIEQYNDFNFLFHSLLWSTADNEKLNSILLNLWDSFPITEVMKITDYTDIGHDAHRGILNCIMRRDAKGACAAMEHHIRIVMESSLLIYEEQLKAHKEC